MKTPPNLKPFIPVLTFLGVLALFPMGNAIFSSTGLSLILLGVVVVIYYLQYRFACANSTNWKQFFFVFFAKKFWKQNTQNTTNSSEPCRPGPVARHTAFLLNIFVFTFLPFFLAFFFELLPALVFGKKIGEGGGGTVYAIMLVFTVPTGLIVLLLYYIIFGTGLIVSRFRNKSKNDSTSSDDLKHSQSPVRDGP